MNNIFLTFVITLAISTNVFAESKSDLQNNCLVKAIKNAPGNQSIEEVRNKCLPIKTLNSLDKRIKLEKETSDNPFSITPHRPNYLLPFTYAHIKNEPYVDSIENNELNNIEIIFQVSIKYLAIENFIINNLDLQIAFTSISWWQAYNSDISSPFRETNYEPEIILDYQKPFQFLGTTIDNAFISLNHESNGKSGNLSRSWNRIIAGMIWVNNDVSVALKTWWRFPESGLNSLGMPEDDNPNIEKYLGHGELNLLWQISEHHNINMMLRNNLRSDNKGAIKIGWSYPLSKRLKGYVEYFNGYGESLIYYNHHIERIGVGIKLTDWF
jgi:phospholipase A1